MNQLEMEKKIQTMGIRIKNLETAISGLAVLGKAGKPEDFAEFFLLWETFGKDPRADLTQKLKLFMETYAKPKKA